MLEVYSVFFIIQNNSFSEMPRKFRQYVPKCASRKAASTSGSFAQ